MNAQMQSLQDQVDNLYASLTALRNGGDMLRVPASSERSTSLSQVSAAQSISPSTRYRQPPRHPSFRGPTSSAFSLDLAKNTLHNMGYQSLGVDEGVLTHDPTPNASPPAIQPPQNSSNDASRDPIWTFSKEEMIRLCRVYEEEMGLMYPILDIEQVIIHGTNLYEFIDAAVRTGLANPSNPKGINDEQTCILKMVLAISTVVEGDGQSEIGYRLFESIKGAADQRLHSESIEIKSLPFLVLVVSQPSHLMARLRKLLGHLLAALSLLIRLLYLNMLYSFLYIGYLPLPL